MNSGLMCPLPELVKLRQKYKLRLFIDESITFGTLGKNCRGITDHFNVPVGVVFVISESLVISFFFLFGKWLMKNYWKFFCMNVSQIL